jgi:prevent-host-death family protein
MRTSVSVAQLKARLSEHLRTVKRGGEVVITERGVPVARITALDTTERRATRRERLVALGTLRPGKGKVRRALLEAPPGEAIHDDVVAALLAEREEGR